MTSWIVWAVTVAVAALIGFTATHFSVRTLRYVTAAIVIVLLVLVTAYGQTPAGGTGQPDLGAAFALGADRLAGSWFRPLLALWSAQHAPVPGRVGWVVIAVALLLGYRQAEKWALSRQAPQLDTSKLTHGQPSIAGDGADNSGATAGQRHDWLAAEVRFRLAAVDVYSPPILPGGTRSEGLASIAEASGLSGGGLAGAVIRFLAALWPARRRYELRVWVEGAPQRTLVRTGGARSALAQAGTALARTAKAVTIQAGTPKAVTVQAGTVREADETRTSTATRVTVELDEPGAGRTVASKTIAAETIDEAASMVAGYVARQIFVRDPTSPNWCYGASDGRDLGALLLARQERVYVESADDVRASRARQIELLWSVTGADRCAGVVRYELAGLEDLEREQLIALRLHAMNREQYPRFFRGTYRLCSSLEMIADPGYTIFNPAAARVVLDETLDILYRAGRTTIDRCADSDIHLQAGTTGPSVLSHRLREALLRAAQRDLRAIRRQLSFPVVAWNTFRRRDERTVWKPQWRLTTRQAFQDGVCVAELLVAVKHRLNERYLAQRGEAAAGRPPGFIERLWQRKGLHVVSAIVGDATAVRIVLQAPFDAWSTVDAHAAGYGFPSPAPAGRRARRAARLAAVDPFVLGLADPDPSALPGWVPPTRDRPRWLPWQARTASWQAAYNTACLYAVLVKQGLAYEDQVIASLRRVVLNRDSGMERPHDWISNDPEFVPLLRHDSPYKKVRAFLEAQERRDYPMKQTYHVHVEQ
jgi:hypothetical protein